MDIELRFGKPKPYDFDTILDQFSGTKINSFRTSSIPLVQFWKETDVRLKALFDNLKIQCEKPTLCFEYPTSPEKGKGKSSMTDLMILGNQLNIAIEAKFTEYVKGVSQLIKQWLTQGDSENRKAVLGYWTSLIKPFSKGFSEEHLNQVCYQFYHRTASACKTSGNAVVIYQIFYDDETKGFIQEYKNEIKNYVKILNPKENLNFYFWEVGVKQLISDSENIDPFIEMKNKDVYEILKTDFEKI